LGLTRLANLCFEFQ